MTESAWEEPESVPGRLQDSALFDTTEIVLSIFGLIGVGYLAARTGLLSAEVGIGVSQFVFTVAIPLLLFRTLVRADLAGVSPWALWLAYYAAVAVVWAIGHLTIRTVFGRDARGGTVGGFSAAYSNLVLIGVPLIQSVFGERGMVFLAVMVSVNLPVMTLAGSLLHDVALRSDGVEPATVSRIDFARRFLLALVRNPLVLGILAAALWRQLALPLGGPPGYVVDKLADVAGPLALFTSGMSLHSFGIARQVKPAAALALLKLVALPAIVLGLTLLAKLPPLEVQVLTICAACPTGVNATLLAGRMGTGEALASNALLISTALGVGTVAGWLVLVRLLAPI